MLIPEARCCRWSAAESVHGNDLRRSHRPGGTGVGRRGRAGSSSQELLETVWAARTPGRLVATAAGLERLRSTLDAVQLQVVAEMDATKAAAHEGCGFLKDF